MIRQPERGTRNVNDFYYENEARLIKLLNEALEGVELSREEERTFLWLAGLEERTVKNIISAFRKVKKGNGRK